MSKCRQRIDRICKFFLTAQKILSKFHFNKIFLKDLWLGVFLAMLAISATIYLIKDQEVLNKKKR